MEQWSLDTGEMKDSDDGSASLTVYWDGDILDDGEDRRPVRVRAATWPRKSCSSTYAVTVHG